jgi:hypothetical protein
MVIPKSKFLSKFPISKWSFVNCGLFKSMELTKYMIYDITYDIMPINRYEKQLSTSHIVGFQKKNLGLRLLHIISDKFPSYYVPIWLSIIHRYLYQCQI